MRKIVTLLIRSCVFLAMVGTANAADPSLTGGASVSNGVITLVSNTGDAPTTNDVSSASFALPANTTFAQLQTLLAEFNVTDDGCAAGSPRITIHLASGKNVFVYLGSAANVNSCALDTWISSGNLIGNNDVGRYDTSQVQAGTQVSTYQAALTLINSLPAADQVVSSVSFDVDAGYAFTDKEQTVLLRKLTVNSISFPTATPPATKPTTLCKAQQQANPTGFKAMYGTNHNKANAFGNCVSEEGQGRLGRHRREDAGARALVAEGEEEPQEVGAPPRGGAHGPRPAALRQTTRASSSTDSGPPRPRSQFPRSQGHVRRNGGSGVLSAWALASCARR